MPFESRAAALETGVSRLGTATAVPVRKNDIGMFGLPRAGEYDPQTRIGGNQWASSCF